MKRGYDNSTRASRSARTAAQILDSAEKLVRARPLGDVTLADIADDAGISVQTVIRHHGGRAGVLEAMARRFGEGVMEVRSAVEPGDIEGAVDNVLAHYEADGELVLRMLSAETSSPLAAELTREGRAFHRQWVEATFGPLLPAGVRDPDIDALVVAMDLYTWKLLRHDLGRSLDEVRNVVLQVVRAILAGLP